MKNKQAAGPLTNGMRVPLVLLALAALAGCATAPMNPLGLPPSLQGRAELLRLDDPDYERAAAWNALKAPGQGGVLGVAVVRLKEDLPVYRLWSGPAVRDGRGNTNRLGGWWSAQAPQGTTAQYRNDYAVCQGWNELTYLASCTLRRGSVVAVGPGQSVSAQTCGDAGGKESYPQNRAVWQIYVDQPWKRTEELICPAESNDLATNPADLGQPDTPAVRP